MITLDTTRADRLGSYGYGLARTQAFDALANDGIVCTNAVTTAPITLPAHASIMTGLLPPAHGVRDNGAYTLDADHITLAEVLKQNGYATAAFVSAIVLSRRYNLSQGFDTYDDDLWAEDEPKLFMIRDRPAPRTAERAIHWLNDRVARSDAPFFLWVHFFDPHQPYESRYANRHLLPTAYDAEIAQADEGIHAIVESLRTANALDSTLIVVTADHGESLGEHGEKTHAIFVYDATVRVPLVLRYPALLPRGARYDGPVSCIDLFPTILSTIGATNVPANQGANLLPALRGDAPPPQLPQYSESLLSEVGFGMAPLYAVRHEGKKYIRAPKPELYDLAADPREAANRFIVPTPESQRLDATLQRLIDGSVPFRKTAPTNPMDAETLETLRALGYMATERQRDTVVGMDPKDGMALYAKLENARHAAQRRDYTASETLLREILDTNPNHISARNVLGLVLMRMGKYDDAAKEYLASLETDPSQARVLHMLGVLRVRQKRFDEARTFCRRAVEIAPNLVESMVILGFTAAQNGDNAEAELWYERALKADPTMPRAQLAFADLYFLREQYGDALAYYRKVLDTTPNHFAALLQAGLCAQRQSKPGEAIDLFQRAATLRPDSWIPPYNLACVSAQQGNLGDADRLLRASAKLAPDDTDLVEIARRDPDLAGLRADPRWEGLARELGLKQQAK
ncbi:MAG: sulfatase-like hydrolase/transferase [Candidatus Hydrogenedentes bacterium]|nr:sulfatase-like hydrolase/transferase [Candidatus Hydrogenedentota bacterium]